MPIATIPPGVELSSDETRVKVDEIIDAVNTLSGEATPGQVAVDASATPGYLGSDAAEGVLRVDSTLTRTDGGNYVTLGVTPDSVVNSISTEGATALTGAVTLSEGANVTLTQAGQDIEVAATMTPAGSDGQVQYNNGGSLGGDSAFTFDDTTKALSAGLLGTTQSHSFSGETVVCTRLGGAAGIVGQRRHATAILANEVLAQFVGWGRVDAWAAAAVGAYMQSVASENWSESGAHGSRLEFWTVANGGTTAALAASIANNKLLRCYGSIQVDGSGTLGGANTDVFTFLARMLPRTTATNPVDSTPANRPTGSAGELALYSNQVFICTDAGTPTWRRIATWAEAASFTSLSASGTVTFSSTVNLNGNTTLGDASTDTITCTGRLNPRLCASDPLHATAGSRPAGTVGEIARYGGDFYICRNATTPEWAKIGGTKSTSFSVVGSGTNCAVGDGVYAFRVPSDMNGMNLIGVGAGVVTAGTTGTTDIQLRRLRDTAGTPRTRTAADMLSTKLTIDSAEVDSETAATAAVIDTSYDDVQTGDLILVDIDAVSTTAPKGLSVSLVFALPTI